MEDFEEVASEGEKEMVGEGEKENLAENEAKAIQQQKVEFMIGVEPVVRSEESRVGEKGFSNMGEHPQLDEKVLEKIVEKMEDKTTQEKAEEKADEKVDEKADQKADKKADKKADEKQSEVVENFSIPEVSTQLQRDTQSAVPEHVQTLCIY